MAYITNDGARLIERARTEGKSIAFGSVRMNTVYKSDPTSLVQKTEEWYGESHGHVVGCISHVSVNGVSCICDSKLAVQCNDNIESWKSIGIYARLDGEEDEVLLACESIENGEYKDVTIVELPVTLDGVVEDFGLSEGGGGGGGGEAPANMMTTNTEQTGLSGMKQWSWEVFRGSGSLDNPDKGDRKDHVKFSINGANEGVRIPIVFESQQYEYNDKDGVWFPTGGEHILHISTDGVSLSTAGQWKFAQWSSIINAAKMGWGVSQASISVENGIAYLSGNEPHVQINPSNAYKLDGMTFLVINAEGQIAAVRATRDAVIDISAAVYNGDGTKNNVSGISANESDISFEPPIPLVGEQKVYVHWTIIK